MVAEYERWVGERGFSAFKSVVGPGMGWNEQEKGRASEGKKDGVISCVTSLSSFLPSVDPRMEWVWVWMEMDSPPSLTIG